MWKERALMISPGKKDSEYSQWKFLCYWPGLKILWHLPYLASPPTRRQGGSVIWATIAHDLNSLLCDYLPTWEISGTSGHYSFITVGQNKFLHTSLFSTWLIQHLSWQDADCCQIFWHEWKDNQSRKSVQNSHQQGEGKRRKEQEWNERGGRHVARDNKCII